MGTSELAVVMIRPGTRADPRHGRKHRAVDPDGDDGDAAGTHAHLCDDVAPLEDSDTVTTRGTWRATRFCMPTKPYQRRRLIAPLPGLGVGQVEPAVDRDGVVDRRR